MPTLTQTAQKVINIVLLGLIFFLGIPIANAQKETPPEVPDAIRRPSGEELLLVAHATGSQIYTCQTGADGKFAWTLKAPEAELKDGTGKVIGSHFGGPAWKMNDGSQVTGKATAHVDSPESDSIPWLLVNVVSHSGDGVLSKVTTIQRVHAHGGKAPAEGCDASHRDAETKRSYTADYYFYAPAR
jgi:hypothetical protein